MKKILAFFAALSIGISSIAMVISCGSKITNFETSLLDFPKLIKTGDQGLSMSFDKNNADVLDDEIINAFKASNKNLVFDDLSFHVYRDNNPKPRLVVQVKPGSTTYQQGGLVSFFLFFKDDNNNLSPGPTLENVELQQTKFAAFEYGTTLSFIKKTFEEANPKYAADFDSGEINVQTGFINNLKANIYVNVIANSQKYNDFNRTYEVDIKPYPAIPFTKTTFTLSEAELDKFAKLEDKKAYVIEQFKTNNPKVDFEQFSSLDAVVDDKDGSTWILTYKVKSNSKVYLPEETNSFTLSIVKSDFISIPFTKTTFTLSEVELDKFSKLEDKKAYVIEQFKTNNPKVDFEQFSSLDAVVDDKGDAWILTYKVKSNSKLYLPEDKGSFTLIIIKRVKKNVSFVNPAAPFPYGSKLKDVRDWFIDANQKKGINMDGEMENHGIILDVYYTGSIDANNGKTGIIDVEITKNSLTYNSNHIKIGFFISNVDTRQNISILNFKRQNVNDVVNDKTGIIDKIRTEIKKLSPTATDDDYEIFGLNGQNEQDLLKYHDKEHRINGFIVRAKPESKKLVGEFNVEVYKDLNKRIQSWNLPVNGSIDIANDTKTIFTDNLKTYLSDIEQLTNDSTFGDYLIKQQDDGSWSALSTHDSRLYLNFMFTTQKESLALLQENFVNKVMVKDDYDKLVSDIKENIKKISPRVEDKDFIITSVDDQQTNVSGKSQITVKADDNSKRLKDSFTIDVNKIDISNYSTDDFKVLTNFDEVIAKVINLIQEDAENKELKINWKDLLNQNGTLDLKVIADQDDPDHKLIVRATDESKYLTGSFTIKLNKYNLKDVIVDTTGLDVQDNETIIRKRLYDGVKELLKTTSLSDEQIQKETDKIKLEANIKTPTDVTWTASLADNASEYLIGKKEIFLNKVSLLNLVNAATITLGDLTLDELKAQLIPDAYKDMIKEVRDYEVDASDTANLTKAGNVIVKPAKGSNAVLQGDQYNAIIKVLPKTVEKVELFGRIVDLKDPWVQNLGNTIKTKLEAEFNKGGVEIPVDENLENNVDFSLKNEDGQSVSIEFIKNNPGIYQLVANKDSKKISGKFSFAVGPINLGSTAVKNAIANFKEINLGNDKKVAVNNVIDEIEKIVGPKFKLQEGESYDDNADYTVVQNDSRSKFTDGTTVLEKGKITIKANTRYSKELDENGNPIITSKLYGEVSIAVKGKSIGDLSLPTQFLRDKNDLTNPENNGFKTLIRNKIQTDLFEGIKGLSVTNDDFDVYIDGHLASEDSQAGTYTVIASPNSTILEAGDNEKFSFQVLPEDISSLTKLNLSFYLNDEANIKKVIAEKLNFFSDHKLIAGPDADYWFYADPTGIKEADLNAEGKVYVIAKSKGYIEKSFSFEIKQSEINNDNITFSDQDDEKLLLANATTTDLDNFKNEVINKVKNVTTIKQLSESDFAPIDWGLAFKDGQVKISAAQSSNYIKGNFDVKIKPVSLTTLAEEINDTNNPLKDIVFGDEFAEDGQTVLLKRDEKIRIKDGERKESEDTKNLSKEEIKRLYHDVMLDQVYKTGKEQQIHTKVNELIKNKFVDSYVVTHNLFNVIEGQDYTIKGLNDNSLALSGSNAITISSIVNNRFIKDSFSLGVDSYDLAAQDNSDSTMKLYSISGNNYWLTSTMSAWVWNKEFFNSLVAKDGDISQWVLEQTNDNPIQADEILGVSDSFLVTTKGIYYTTKLIPHTAGLTSNDVLSISNESVLTTKGGWYINNYDMVKSAANYLDLTPIAIPQLSEAKLSRDDFLGISQNIIVTTKGIWLKGIHQETGSTIETINWKKVTDKSNDYVKPENLTSYNILAVNNHFLVTRKGAWALTPNNQKAIGNNDAASLTHKHKAAIPNQDAIASLNDNYLYIKNVGIYESYTDDKKTVITPGNDDNGESKIRNPLDPETNELKLNNYLITPSGIYWKGHQVGFVNKKTNEIIEVGDDWLITTKSVFYHGDIMSNKRIAPEGVYGNFPDSFISNLNTYFDSTDKNGNKPKIIAMTSSWLIGSKVVQYKNKQETIDQSDTTTDRYNQVYGVNSSTREKDHEVMGIGKNFLALKGNYRYFVTDKASIKVEHKDNETVDKDIVVGSYWIIPWKKVKKVEDELTDILFTNNYYLRQIDGDVRTYYFDYETGNFKKISEPYYFGSLKVSTNSIEGDGDKIYNSGNFLWYRAETADHKGLVMFYKGNLITDTFNTDNFNLNEIIAISDDRIITSKGVYYCGDGSNDDKLYRYGEMIPKNL